MAVSIIEAGVSDIPVLLELMEEFYSESDYTVDAGKAAQSFRAFISNDSLGNVFCAKVEDRIVGYLIVKYYYAMGNYGFVCSIDDLFVNKEHRNQKAGALLLEEALRTAAEKGILNFNVEVGAKNTVAMRLYEKYGFERRNKGIEIMEKELVRQAF